MIKKLGILLVVFAMLFSFACVFAEEGKITFYVSTLGNDSNDGLTIETALATLEGARVKVREALKKHENGINIEVIFKSGTYRFSETVMFDKNDSAVEGYTVTYRGEGEVYFKGSIPIDITKISLVTDTKILKRLPTTAKGHVGQIDLKEQGIDTDSFSTNVSDNAPEDYAFFLNNKEQICAEWPNGDGNYAQYQTVYKAGGSGKYTKDVGGVFKYEESNPDRWVGAKDFYVIGYFSADYVANRSLVKSVNPETQAIELAYGTDGGIKTSFSRRWKAVNLLEEIDVPGEWYLDRENDILYYYPEKSLHNAEFEMSMLDDYFIKMTGTKNLTFQNIHFTQGRSGAITASSYPENIVIDSCTFTHFGRSAVTTSGSVSGTVNKSHEPWKNRIDGAKNFLITNCTFAYLRQDGVRMVGGNRDTLTPSGNVIENNYFYQCADKYQGYYYGIKLNAGCGDIVRNNVMNNFSFHCIDYTGNDYKIYNNELYNAVRETSDCGIIYTGRSFTERGTEISYNYIHDGYPVDSRVPPSSNGVYLDDNIQGQIVHHNIFYNVHRGVCGNGAMDHQIYSNIFVDSAFATHMNTNFLTNASTIERNLKMFSDIENNEYYRNAYPNLADFVGKYEKIAAHNVVKDNVAYNANFTIYDDVKKYGEVDNNITLDSTVAFMDYANKDFRLKGENSNALDSSFDMNTIGLKRNEETGEFNIPKLLYSDFQQIYPKNGEANISFKDIYFKWEDALGADKYRLVIAKDKDLKDVVIDTEVNYNYYTVTELDPAIEKYYWKVTAINYSNQLNNTWESDNAVFVFNLSPDYELDKTILEKNLISAKEFLGQIVEGDSVGSFKNGTKAVLKSIIEDGEKLLVLDKEKTTQKEINDCAKAINDFIDSDEIINSGFYDLGKSFSNDGSWGDALVSEGENSEKIMKTDGSEKTVSTGYTGIYAGSRNSILCFKMRGTFLNETHGWIGFGLRGDSSKNIAASGNDNYFFVVKENVLEFQRNLRGPAIIKEFDNTALTFGEWHDVQFGVINLGTAQMIVLNVDGKNVLEYIDSSSSQHKHKGHFVFNANKNHILEFAPSENIPPLEEYKKLVKRGYEALQKEYFETIKTVSDNSIMMRVNCKNYVTEEGVETFTGGVPVILGDKTMVPLRTISEFFGAEVSWDDNSRSAVIKVKGNEIEFFENKNIYSVNGEEKTLQQVPVIQDGSLLVPLRDISESIGKEVYWYETGLIIIGTNQRVDTQNKYALLNDISTTFEKMNNID